MCRVLYQRAVIIYTSWRRRPSFYMSVHSLFLENIWVWHANLYTWYCIFLELVCIFSKQVLGLNKTVLDFNLSFLSLLNKGLMLKCRYEQVIHKGIWKWQNIFEMWVSGSGPIIRKALTVESQRAREEWDVGRNPITWSDVLFWARSLSLTPLCSIQ